MYNGEILGTRNARLLPLWLQLMDQFNKNHIHGLNRKSSTPKLENYNGHLLMIRQGASEIFTLIHEEVACACIRVNESGLQIHCKPSFTWNKTIRNQWQDSHSLMIGLGGDDRMLTTWSSYLVDGLIRITPAPRNAASNFAFLGPTEILAP